MKLTRSKFLPEITKEGAEELYSFCAAILLKHGLTESDIDYEDVLQNAVVKCIEKLPAYDPAKNSELGGFLYLYVRGELSKYFWRAKTKAKYETYLEEAKI